VTLRPTPNVEDQDIPFCLDRHLSSAQHGLLDFIFNIISGMGHAVALLVEALCDKPESCGFDSQCHGIFQLT
jgi:hypothetical protein